MLKKVTGHIDSYRLKKVERKHELETWSSEKAKRLDASCNGYSDL